MKNFYSFLLSLCILFSSYQSSGQPHGSRKNFTKLTCGRVLFGTGDIVGYGINIEYSSRLKTSKKILKHFLIGAELSFENGTNNPVIENPTPEQFFAKTFGHYSISLISGKITYYPFRSIFNGLNISIGPSFGYMLHSYEVRAQRVVYSPTFSQRISTLRFDNKFLIGYRITAGYEFKAGQRLSAGFRLDFANYNNGDINTLLAGKIGYNF